MRDSINTFGTNAIGSLLSIISAFFVLGVLDPDVKGQYNQVQLVGNGLFTLFGFSINAAMIYFVSRFKIKNTKKAITTLTTAMSILIMAAGAAAVLFMKQIFFPGSTAFYCWAAVVYGLFSFLLNVCLAILRGENKFKMFKDVYKRQVSWTERPIASWQQSGLSLESFSTQARPAWPPTICWCIGR